MEEFQREIAKMLMDVVKYLVTGVIIVTLLGEFEDKDVVVRIALSSTFACLLGAGLLFYFLEKKKKEQEKNDNKQTNKKRK